MRCSLRAGSERGSRQSYRFTIQVSLGYARLRTSQKPSQRAHQARRTARRRYRRNSGPIPEGYHIHHRDGKEPEQLPRQSRSLARGGHTRLHARAGRLRSRGCRGLSVEGRAVDKKRAPCAVHRATGFCFVPVGGAAPHGYAVGGGRQRLAPPGPRFDGGADRRPGGPESMPTRHRTSAPGKPVVHAAGQAAVAVPAVTAAAGSQRSMRPKVTDEGEEQQRHGTILATGRMWSRRRRRRPAVGEVAGG